MTASRPRGEIGGARSPRRAEFRVRVLRADGAHGIAEFAQIRIADFLRIRYGGTDDAKRHRRLVPAIRDAFVGIKASLSANRAFRVISMTYRPDGAKWRPQGRRKPPKRAIYGGRDTCDAAYPQAPTCPQAVQKSQPSRRISVAWPHSGQVRPATGAGDAPGAGASVQSVADPARG